MKNVDAKRRIAAILIFSPACTGLMLVLGSYIFPVGLDGYRPSNVQSLRVYDTRGELLREYLNDDEGRGMWTSVDDVSPHLLNAVIAVEDKRFRSHSGVDVQAIGRSVLENLSAGRVVQGGSTITQQVVRLVRRRPRTLPSKLVEAWEALRLEHILTKDQILEQYLNRAPFGNQLVGAEAASRYYFDKPCSDLSLAEAAFLAGLPNAPAYLNPGRSSDRALSRLQKVLAAMHSLDMCNEEEYQRALAQPVLIVPPDRVFLAPHAVELARLSAGELRNTAEIVTTIDIGIQGEIESIIRNNLEQLAEWNVTNAAVVVIEHETGDVRALAGSADFFDADHNGQVNGALALRQPGSSVKPFTYAVALEHGYSAASLLADVPAQIPDKGGVYTPENYDRRFHGPVTLRTALACSYNVPAVRVARDIGAANLLERFRAFGLSTLSRAPEHYGLGLTLGNGDVTLLDLTNAYAALARGGTWKPVRLVSAVRSVDGSTQEPFRDDHSDRRVVRAEVAALIARLLDDPVARRPAFGGAFSFPFPCAVKTGTTKDYRDNWTMGFTSRFAVGVWVGNFDGVPMRGVSGVSGAGPIFTDIMNMLHRKQAAPAFFPYPAGAHTFAVCSRSGMSPSPVCPSTIDEIFLRGNPPLGQCTVHRAFRVPTLKGKTGQMVYEILPEEYEDWVVQEGIPRPPADAVPLSMGVQGYRREELAIVSPNPGDVFKLDPTLRREYQSILVRAVVPDGLREPELLVDGIPAGKISDGSTWWPMREGNHTLAVRGKNVEGDRRSRPVTILVE